MVMEKFENGGKKELRVENPKETTFCDTKTVKYMPENELAIISKLSGGSSGDTEYILDKNEAGEGKQIDVWGFLNEVVGLDENKSYAVRKTPISSLETFAFYKKLGGEPVYFIDSVSKELKKLGSYINILPTRFVLGYEEMENGKNREVIFQISDFIKGYSFGEDEYNFNLNNGDKFSRLGSCFTENFLIIKNSLNFIDYAKGLLNYLKIAYSGTDPFFYDVFPSSSKVNEEASFRQIVFGKNENDAKDQVYMVDTGLTLQWKPKYSFFYRSMNGIIGFISKLQAVFKNNGMGKEIEQIRKLANSAKNAGKWYFEKNKEKFNNDLISESDFNEAKKYNDKLISFLSKNLL